MSNPSPSQVPVTPARPVSLITIVFLFVLFGAFLFTARYFYRPAQTAPQNATPENYAKDLEWRATDAARRTALTDLQKYHAEELTKYRWLDQQAGVVQLPIDRAMVLTVEKYGQKK